MHRLRFETQVLSDRRKIPRITFCCVFLAYVQYNRELVVWLVIERTLVLHAGTTVIVAPAEEE